MARLGLNINIDAQRLLAANKERAASNRAALEERKHTKENAAEKVQLAADAATRPGSPTQNEEPGGGTPDLYRQPEPAAQRRKNKYLVFGLDDTASRPAPGTAKDYEQTWVGYLRDGTTDVRESPPITFSQLSTFTGTNKYKLEDKIWQPTFKETTPRNGQMWPAPAHNEGNHLLAFNWTFRQRSGRSTASGGVFPEVRASIPDLPLQLRDTVIVAESIPYNHVFPSPTSSVIDRTFTSCDGEHIYHSRLIRVRRPADRVFYGFSGPGSSLYDPDMFERVEATILPSPMPGFIFSFVNAQDYTLREITEFRPGEQELGGNRFTSSVNEISYNDSWWGLYWKFNARTKQPVELRTKNLGGSNTFTNYETRSSLVAKLFDSMESGDPVYKLWRAHVSNNLTASNVGLLDSWLSPTSFLGQWPSGLVYDEQRQWLTLVTTPLAMPAPLILSKRVTTPPTYYDSIPSLFLPPAYTESSTTIGEYIANGWKDEGPVPPGTALLENYFAIKK